MEILDSYIGGKLLLLDKDRPAGWIERLAEVASGLRLPRRREVWPLLLCKERWLSDLPVGWWFDIPVGWWFDNSVGWWSNLPVECWSNLPLDWWSNLPVGWWSSLPVGWIERLADVVSGLRFPRRRENWPLLLCKKDLGSDLPLGW